MNLKGYDPNLAVPLHLGYNLDKTDIKNACNKKRQNIYLPGIGVAMGMQQRG
jgi:hypothetical protein